MVEAALDETAKVEKDVKPKVTKAAKPAPKSKSKAKSKAKGKAKKGKDAPKGKPPKRAAAKKAKKYADDEGDDDDDDDYDSEESESESEEYDSSDFEDEDDDEEYKVRKPGRSKYTEEEMAAMAAAEFQLELQAQCVVRGLAVPIQCGGLKAVLNGGNLTVLSPSRQEDDDGDGPRRVHEARQAQGPLARGGQVQRFGRDEG